MSEFLKVLGLALLSALGNFGGGVIAEWLHPSQKTLNRALHAATGIILAVIAVEVIPKVLDKASTWLLALSFVAGGAAYLLLEAGIDRWQRSKPKGAGTGAWMVYTAVATDLLGDGLLIGAGSALSGQMGLVLALGQVLADIPEGFAVVANFREKGMGQTKRILISASFAVPVVAAAAFAYFALRGQGEAVKVDALVFVAGLYTLAAVEDMLRRPMRAPRTAAGLQLVSCSVLHFS
ncbi:MULTISPECIES: ZIP family metal transporter [Gimesia]|jgi:ZIP family zinc transporter|uniref:ZIP Zinc transporter n=2 Tax=Gimesia TaxID=1649453 RepID=A0A517PVU3_9PLAN|nr:MULTISPECIES: hypothetical protein [Gimesia]QDT23485.1 ZIP Zinc transporter [Gimesia chilikensis]|tara:strand:- start:6317 stop:7024 length:708 start_codon:yes stop_codon:yes gene_type:complete